MIDIKNITEKKLISIRHRNKHLSSAGRRMYQKRSIIPNSFTMTNMVLGFIAVIFAGRGTASDLAVAGVLVLAASFFDLIDGAAARALGVASPVGLQLDSLADAVAYGIAPGIISYQAFLCRLPDICFGVNWGMLIAMIFPICATYRLARFNVDEPHADGFQGLPSPAAGIFIASIPALPSSRIFLDGHADFTMPLGLFVPLFAFTALLMVSSVDYSKIFTKMFRTRKRSAVFIVVLLLLGLLYFNMWLVFVLDGLYIMTGLLVYVYRQIKRKQRA